MSLTNLPIKVFLFNPFTYGTSKTTKSQAETPLISSFFYIFKTKTILSSKIFSHILLLISHFNLISIKAVVLKLCVATPRCVVSIFQRRRGKFWFCAIKFRFYCVKRTLIADSFLTFFWHFHNDVFNTLLQRLTCYSRIKLQKFNLIGEKYIKNKAFSCLLDKNRKDELQT